MLLRLGETLKQKFSISSQPTRNHLDIFVDGFAFRVTISHSREASLIQEDITTLERAEAANEVQKPYLLARVPRGLTPAVLPALRKELAAVQLAGHFVPLHSSTVNAVMLKHSAVAVPCDRQVLVPRAYVLQSPATATDRATSHILLHGTRCFSIRGTGNVCPGFCTISAATIPVRLGGFSFGS